MSIAGVGGDVGGGLGKNDRMGLLRLDTARPHHYQNLHSYSFLNDTFSKGFLEVLYYHKYVLTSMFYSIVLFFLNIRFTLFILHVHKTTLFIIFSTKLFNFSEISIFHFGLGLLGFIGTLYVLNDKVRRNYIVN